ncbi:MAG: hypothetical protein LBR22_07105 [Desulfovibrio sp.]|jgi:hypothetical protein|nr:hypothetical protein [Desulfovibrio sp.]
MKVLLPPPSLPPLNISMDVRNVTLASLDGPGRRSPDIPKDMLDLILARDRNACLACGMVADGSGALLEMHHLDGDHTNNAHANVASLCPLCHGTLDIWHLAHESPLAGHAEILYLPGLSPTDLNMLVWTMAVAHAKCQEGGEPSDKVRKFTAEVRAAALMLHGWGRIADALPDDWAPGFKAPETHVLADPVPLAGALLALAGKGKRDSGSLQSKLEPLLYGLRVFCDPLSLPMQRMVKPLLSSPAWHTEGEDWLEKWTAVHAAVMKTMRSRVS